MKSIKAKLVLAFIIINVTITSFFSFFVYWVASGIIEKNYIHISDTTISDAISRVDMFLDKMDKYSIYLVINQEIIKILTKEYGPNINYPRLFSEQVQNLTITEGDMLAIHYFSNEGDAYHFPLVSNVNSLEDLKKLGLLNEEKLEDGKTHWSKVYPQTYYQSDRQQDTKIFSGVRSFKTSFQSDIKGVMSIDMSEEVLFGFIKSIKLGETGKVYIVNKAGSIMTSSDRNKVSQNIDKNLYNIIAREKRGYAFNKLDGVKKLIVYNTSESTGWKIVATIPLGEVLFETGYIKVMAVIVAFIIIILSSLVSFFISSKITKPIREMTTLVKEVAGGNLDVKYVAGTSDELKELSDGFNYMTSNLKELINKVYIEEIQLKQAQLENLKSKINPHFLYNTLDAIYWMLVIARQNETAKLVVALSDMLRYSISRSEEQVKVSEEIKQIENYLYIQKVRFKDRLQVEYDLDDNILDLYMIKLIIQPIVENSIKHGLECQSKKGTILIKGMEKEDGICFQIIDDGKGMAEDEIMSVLNNENDSSLLKKPGIGVNNVNDRIKMFYGQKYGLSIESKPGQGTCVNVYIPKVTKLGGEIDA